MCIATRKKRGRENRSARVGVGWVGMVGVRVVGWRVANELVDKKVFVRSVLSKVEELLFDVFDELLV